VSLHNAWSNPSAVSPDDAAQMAGFLEDRARFPDQCDLNQRLLATVAPRPGEHVLEVGSGSGVLCRMAAPAVAPGGLVVGVDIAPDMAVYARARAGCDGLGDPGLRFHTGAAERLPYAAGSFDAAFAARLLLHAADRATVVEEMARVVRAGGRVVLMDWDFGTVAVDHPDRALTRRILEWRTDHHGGDNWSGRQLPGDMAAAGFRAVQVHPVAQAARDEHSALTQSLWRAAEVCRDAGAITPAEHAGWVGELKARIAAGRFCAGIVYFIVRGER
jgi:ubiquinone/menaquinone biosynthesis C-methylase UbiE